MRNNTCSICQVAALPCAPAERLICTTCEKHLMLRLPVPLFNLGPDPVFAACEFPYRLKRLIYQLKFHAQTQYGIPLADVMAQYWQGLPGYEANQPYCIVPIPRHLASETDQDSLSWFARPFASHFGYHYIADGLAWRRPVQAQHGIFNRRMRRQNVSGALVFNEQRLSKLPPETKILIVDDILTTGATMAEAVRTARRACPDHAIQALTLAHVPLHLAAQNLQS